MSAQKTGDIILRGRTQVRATRVFSPRDGRSRLEKTTEGTGTLAGTEILIQSTAELVEIGPDSYTATSTAVLTAKEGGDIVLSSACGAAHREAGAQKLIWRGHLALSTRSSRFADLDGALVAFVSHLSDSGELTVEGTKWR
ncbi:hypothetical protein ACFQ2B_35690 [Streptomyces stramineus]|uniref:Uncharacterized protein n=1 Tax=Streptomyces stramineus TaxID=173861 RepID=A0ABN0ZCK9_9ACTN